MMDRFQYPTAEAYLRQSGTPDYVIVSGCCWSHYIYIIKPCRYRWIAYKTPSISIVLQNILYVFGGHTRISQCGTRHLHCILNTTNKMSKSFSLFGDKYWYWHFICNIFLIHLHIWFYKRKKWKSKNKIKKAALYIFNYLNIYFQISNLDWLNLRHAVKFFPPILKHYYIKLRVCKLIVASAGLSFSILRRL